ncbi:PepSY-associated TM helix domain-containing protein [Roseateles sp. BYS78W]|uniref:PepSY-associated TM helix domain-containing protein n=1 Tax=Pelomonas candidula TaxID=3299025 RepID=A0ABW7HJX8_9BURK
MTRRVLAWLHRWVSLIAGLLLAVLGLSGSLLVWQAELDAALNPDWFRPLPACEAPAGDDAAQPPVARVLAVLKQQAPGRQAAIVVAPHQPGAAYQVWERRDADGLRREHFIDAACGRYLGMRERGRVAWDARHLVPTVYELHRYLWQGEAGALVVGAGGLVLLGLSLSGVVLAWPRQARRLASWRRVLGIQWRAAPARRWYDVHRAVGLWLAPLLMLMTVTGAAMVFSDAARSWVSAVLPLERLPKAARAAAATELAPAGPALAPDEWVALAERQFPQARWSRLTLPRGGAAVEVRLLQPGEPRADTGNTRVRLTLAGALVQRYDPLHAPAGNVVLNWLFPLHSAEAFGLAARVLWSAFGLVPALLLGTGLWLWWRRSRAANLARRRAPAARPSPG